MRKSVIVLMLLFALTVVACTSVDDETFDHYANEAEQIIYLINDGKYEEVVYLFADDLKAELDGEDLREIESMIAESGAFESIKKVVVDETEEMTTDEKIYVTVTTAVYEHKNRTYTISFNEADELVGFYIK